MKLRRGKSVKFPDPANDYEGWNKATQTVDFHDFVDLLVKIREAIGFIPESILDFGYGWGISSCLWLTSFRDAEVFCCDPLGQYMYGETDPVSKLPECMLKRWIFVWNSAEVILPYLDKTFDFIFVDADHQYQSTLTQIKLAWEKLQPGGVMAGHDWDQNNVKLAVEQFADDVNIEIEELTGDHGAWLVRK